MKIKLLTIAALFSCQPSEEPKIPMLEATPTNVPSTATAAPAASLPPQKEERPALEPEATHLAQSDEKMFLEIASNYQKWGRVDETPNIAPELCRAPVYPNDYGRASQVRESQAADKSPHGKKLYYLFAKDKFSYLTNKTSKAQVIVKQSWTSKKAEPPTTAPGEIDLSKASLNPPVGASALSLLRGLPPITTLTTENGTFAIDKQASLYMMAYVGEDKEGTDNGWWYATATPDGKTITASGKISTCMGCHTKAPHGRLFGLKQDKK